MATLPKPGNIVLDHRYFLGTFKDFSGQGNHGTPTSGVYFQNTIDGRKGLRFGAAQAVDVTDDASLQLTEGTILGYGDFVNMNEQSRIVAKRDGGGTNYDFHYNDATNQICMFDGATNACIIKTTAGSKTLGCIFGNSEAPNFYIDGLLVGTSASTNAITVDDASLTVGNLYTKSGDQEMRNPMSGALIWNVQLTASEMAQAHEWVMEQVTPTHPKQNFYFGSQVNPQEPNLTAAWDGTKGSGKVVDLVAGSNNLTINGAGHTTKYGLDGWLFNGAETLTGTSIDMSSGGTVEVVFELDDVSGTQTIFESTLASGNRFGIVVHATDLRSGALSGGSYYKSTGASTLNAGQLYHAVCSFDGSTTTVLALNGVNQTSTATPSITATDRLTIGASNADSQFFNGKIFFVKRYSDAKTAAWAAVRYQDLMQRLPVFIDTLQDANVSVATEGGAKGNYLSNTAWKFGDTSARYKVSSQSVFNNPYAKVIECTTAGVLYQESLQAYGTWEFALNKAATTTPYILFVADVIGIYSATNQDQYSIAVNGDELVALGKRPNAGPPSNLCTTATGYVSESTWYKFRVTRSYAGSFSVYILGGAFTSWTLVDVTGGSGTNPVTDTAITASKYCVLDLDAGDKVTDFKFYHGVLDPTV